MATIFDHQGVLGVGLAKVEFPGISFRDERFPDFSWNVVLVTYHVRCFWRRFVRVGFRTRRSQLRFCNGFQVHSWS